MKQRQTESKTNNKPVIDRYVKKIDDHKPKSSLKSRSQAQLVDKPKVKTKVKTLVTKLDLTHCNVQ